MPSKALSRMENSLKFALWFCRAAQDRITSMTMVMAILCLIGALVLLVILSIIDLQVRLLPNKYVLPFAVCGAAFHLVTFSAYLSPVDIFAGAALGFGLLYLIRAAANRYYGMDALGLGDVKLMGAAGIWLGVEGVLFALTAGAFAGLLHGLGYGMYVSWRDKTPLNLHRLAIPAGPGFAVGIVIAGIYLFQPFFEDVVYEFFS
jgi:leader peptidase (prepilin peptidase)/N-methyltransferase